MKNEANRRKLSKDVIYTIHTSFPLHSNIQNGFPKAPSCCGDYIKIIICRLICLYRCLNLDCSQVCFGIMEKQIALQGVKWRESTGENQCVKNLKRVWGGAHSHSCTFQFFSQRTVQHGSPHADSAQLTTHAGLLCVFPSKFHFGINSLHLFNLAIGRLLRERDWAEETLAVQLLRGNY